MFNWTEAGNASPLKATEHRTGERRRSNVEVASAGAASAGTLPWSLSLWCGECQAEKIEVLLSAAPAEEVLPALPGATSAISFDEHLAGSGEGEDEGDVCVVCYDGADLVTMQPCGHARVCKECVHRLRKCPLCRARLASWQLGVESCIFGLLVWV